MYILINWFIRNPVAANLLMLLILATGAISLISIRIEGFPKIPPDSISINLSYPGASAEQVNEGIVLKVEQVLEGVPGVERVVSVSYKGNASITIQKQDGYNLERLQNDIKSKVDSITGLPENAEKAIISREDFSFPTMIFQVYGNVDRDTLQKLGERSRKALLARKEISKLKMWGDRKRIISIEILPEKLEELGLTLSEVTNVLTQTNIQYRTGRISSSTQEITIRADHQAYHIKDFGTIAVYKGTDGALISLGDIAKITDGFEDDKVLVRYQGVPAIGLEIMMGYKDNILDISEAVHQVKEEIKLGFPDNVHIDIWANQSNYITERLALLQNNAFIGLLIVFVILALFLNIKVAFWVAMGIPFSIAGAFAVMTLGSFDYSLNDITTFGFILVLGILVDDAIVVGESVHKEKRKIENPVEATEKGIQRVATATIFGGLTTVAAFYPMLLIENPLGKVLSSFSVIVIITIMFSLMESKLILPAHLAAISIYSSKHKSNVIVNIWTWTQKSLNRMLDTTIHSLYRPILTKLLVFRYETLIIFTAITILGIGLIATSTIRSVFFPDIPSKIITVLMTMDKQSPHSLTLSNTNELEKKLILLNDELVNEYQLNSPPVGHVMTAVIGSGNVQMYAEITTRERQIDTVAVLNRWRELVGQLEGVTELSFSASEMMGEGFQIEILSNDDKERNDGVRTIVEALESYQGVYDIRNELKRGGSEILVKLKPEALHLGINESDLARFIGDSYGGLEIQRIQRGNNEVKVVLRYPRNSRDSLSKLINSRIKTPSGEWVPLLSVATLQANYAPVEVVNRNGKRSALIKANIDKKNISPVEVYERLALEVIPSLRAQYPSMIIKPSGELEEIRELKVGIIKALVLTLILIYTLLAIPLKSYWQPLVIMSVIPLGVTGAAFGHLISDIPLSVLSFFGIMGLTGIVVNDSLVLITRYNQNLEEGMALDEALTNAGTSRFRAIFLTTVTTIGGLAPMLFETSEQAQYLLPAVVSLVYGELFATVIILILVPLLIKISADFKING